MNRAAAIASLSALVAVAGSAAPREPTRKAQIAVAVGVVPACGVSTARSVSPVQTDLAALRTVTRVSCAEAVPYRVEILGVAADGSAPAPLVVSVEF
jgi:hypothetical protein